MVPALIVGCAASLLALVIRRERRRYRERTQVDRIKVRVVRLEVHPNRLALVPWPSGQWVPMPYSPEDSGEPRWT